MINHIKGNLELLEWYCADLPLFRDITVYHSTSVTCIVCCTCTVQPKIFEVENFHGFRGSENGCEIFKVEIRENFKFITDARHGWKLDHGYFIHENLFLSRIWQNRKIVNPRKLGYMYVVHHHTLPTHYRIAENFRWTKFCQPQLPLYCRNIR